MTDPHELPPAAVLVTHEVEDFDEWKRGFDNHEDARRAAGALAHHLNRDRDNPNLVTVFLAVTDVDRAKEFAASEDLKETMEKVGVVSEPVIRWVRPVREDAVWDRELPAFIASARVADFDHWLTTYDRGDELRRSKGIIGHAANRSLDDPSAVIVYHQAEDFETLERFMVDPELQDRMQEGGLLGRPDLRYQNGGWAKRY